MTEIQIFNHPEFGGVRTLGDADNPKFCLSDVCRIMGIGNPSDVKNRLDDGVVSIETLQTNGGIYMGGDEQLHCKEHNYWTQRGRLGLYDLLKSRHYLPLIEREY